MVLLVWLESTTSAACTSMRQDGFSVAKEALGSKVKLIEADFLDLDLPSLGTFDLILFLGILYHLRHPLLGLEQLAEICVGQIVVETATAPTLTGWRRWVAGKSVPDRYVRFVWAVRQQGHSTGGFLHRDALRRCSGPLASAASNASATGGGAHYFTVSRQRLAVSLISRPRLLPTWCQKHGDSPRVQTCRCVR